MQGGLGAVGRRMLEDVAFRYSSFGAGFERPDHIARGLQTLA